MDLNGQVQENVNRKGKREYVCTCRKTQTREGNFLVIEAIIFCRFITHLLTTTPTIKACKRRQIILKIFSPYYTYVCFNRVGMAAAPFCLSFFTVATCF